MLGETWEALTRNKLMTLAAITTAAVSLLMLGGFVALWYEVERQLATLPDRFEMRIFLRDDVTTEQIAAIRSRLDGMSQLSSVRFVSRDEAWSKFRKGIDSDVTEGLPNPLPASFVVKLRSLDVGDQAAALLRLMPEVDHNGVVYLREEQRQVAEFMRFVRLAGLATTVALMFSTGVLIFNTVRLTVLARRKEVRVMQLVGASQGTIRAPFLLEAVAHGAAGGLLAAVALWFNVGALSRFLPGFVRQPGDIGPYWLVVVALVVLGGLFGLICGGVATRRFLRYEPVA